MPEFMLLSNSYAPGRSALEHALEALAGFFAGCWEVLFVPYAGSDPDGYTKATGGDLRQAGRAGDRCP